MGGRERRRFRRGDRVASATYPQYGTVLWLVDSPFADYDVRWDSGAVQSVADADLNPLSVSPHGTPMR